MRIRIQSFLAGALFLGLAGSAWGQNIRLEDPPKILEPKSPPTRQELERRDSLKKYAAGLQLEREDRFDEALKAFEEAARLDPDAPAVFKAQVPILIAMQRLTDALSACKKVVDLNPGDYSIWYVQAKVLKKFAKYPEAIAAMENALKSDLLKDHPEAAQQLYFELGELCESTEKFGPAADAFNKAAAILEHPDQIMRKGPFPRELILARAAETYEKISQHYRKAKRNDEAIASLRKAQERAPERADRINYHLAELCEEHGDLKQALVYIDAYVRTQPLSLEPYDMKIGLMRRLKQTDGIVPWLEAAAARDKHNSGLQRLMAQEYARAKQTKKAETLFQKLAEDSPSPELYRGLFQLYKDEGQPGMARILAMLDKVMDKNAREEGPAPLGTAQQARAMIGALRDDGELAQKLVESAFRQMNAKGELKFDTVYFLAMLADRHRKNEEAERFYRQCLADKSVGPANEAILYGGLLRVLSKARKHEEVVQVCQQGLAKAKSTNPLLFHSDMARAQASLKRYDDALRSADRGSEQAGDKKLLFAILRVRILTMAQRYQKAETECQALLKASERPDDILELRYLLSNVYAAAKQIAKSEDQLQLILKIDPNNATVNNDLGYLWADQGKNLEIAEDMIRKAIDLDRTQRRKSANYSADEDKDNAAYIDSLGWILFRRGQIDDARKELERAITLGDGDDPTIYDHLGDVYIRLRMRQEASRAWQRALELYDQGIRQKDDERVRDIRRKINQAKEDVGGR